MRLAKHLAHAGVASRRAAEVLIAEGRVLVDGAVVTDPARDVTGTERIQVDGERIGSGPMVRAVYAVHKPAGVISSVSDTHGRATVVDLMRGTSAAQARRLYPVGRLDVDTTGLLLLTDDGDLAHQLTHPKFEVPKTYIATIRGRMRPETARRLARGVMLDDGLTLPAEVRLKDPVTVELTLREGRKRQVRRMLEAVGHPVRNLRRVRFGPLELGTLAEGRVRRLTPAEVQALRDAAAGVGGRRT
ncbi:unannotated protein [freshwater metagenome]|uniref:Unannotated protein n=1 Tax=freshwater metagenome TaxID=449393 RepID=A0A6J7I7D6_9ZZZZ|nr:pseudouridine synthase [Actinomycetota bacterium]